MDRKEAEQIIREVDAEVWGEVTRYSIKTEVEKRFAKQLDAALMKVIGFDTRSSDMHWALDHCNGRAGQSQVGEWLKENCTKAIGEYLAASVEKLPKLTKAEATRMRTEYHSMYLRRLRDALEKLARSRAEADAEAMFKAIAGEPQ